MDCFVMFLSFFVCVFEKKNRKKFGSQFCTLVSCWARFICSDKRAQKHNIEYRAHAHHRQQRSRSVARRDEHDIQYAFDIASPKSKSG